MLSYIEECPKIIRASKLPLMEFLDKGSYKIELEDGTNNNYYSSFVEDCLWAISVR